MMSQYTEEFRGYYLLGHLHGIKRSSEMTGQFLYAKQNVIEFKFTQFFTYRVTRNKPHAKERFIRVSNKQRYEHYIILLAI